MSGLTKEQIETARTSLKSDVAALNGYSDDYYERQWARVESLCDMALRSLDSSASAMATPQKLCNVEYCKQYQVCANPDACHAIESGVYLPMRVTDEMVNRFLRWKLPKSVRPDPCVLDQDYPDRSGTNLLTSNESRQMLEHVLAAAPPAQGSSGDDSVDAMRHAIELDRQESRPNDLISVKRSLNLLEAMLDAELDKPNSLARHGLTKARSMLSKLETSSQSVNMVLIDGKPHRFCECDPLKSECRLGAKRTLLTTEFSRCMVPVDNAMIAPGTASLPPAQGSAVASIERQALHTIAKFPITDKRRNLDAVNMQRIAGNALLLAVSPPARELSGDDRVDDMRHALELDRQEAQGSAVELDRDWWRKQGIDACMDRMEVMERQRIVNTSQPASAAPEERRNLAWLVESVAGRWGSGFYWTGVGDYDSWGTIDKAIRFVRKEDALRVIDSLHSHDARSGRTMSGNIQKYEACEHEWPEPVRPDMNSGRHDG